MASIASAFFFRYNGGMDLVNRRAFLGKLALTTASLACARPLSASDRGGSPLNVRHEFRLNYAPCPGLFEPVVGPDLVDQIRYASDRGFRFWEDLALDTRPLELQKRIGRALATFEMQAGLVAAERTFDQVTFAGPDPEARQQVLARVEKAIATAKRIRSRHLAIVPGRAHPTLPLEKQKALTLELLRKCLALVEPEGLLLLLEPVDSQSQPGLFLSQVSQALELCQDLDHPSCQILFDVYHQQLAGGGLIRTLDQAWDHLGYLQLASVPDRLEPGLGEVHLQNVLAHLYQRGGDFILGMEHGRSLGGVVGVEALLRSYLELDQFPIRKHSRPGPVGGGTR
ncbi:MAG: TIM barrel protein [Verrucomicrobiota bacterium]